MKPPQGRFLEIIKKDPNFIFRFREKGLDEISFPVLFKVCITPAFKMDKILEAGYTNLWFYFMGKSRFGNNYGWAGHRRNGSQYSTPEAILKDAVVDIKDVLKHISLKFRGKDSVQFYTKTSRNYVTATLRRPNYPSNCYDIDINKLNRRKYKGFFQIQFNFYPIEDFKVEIVMEDKRKSVSRTYKYNRFGNQGSIIFLSNLQSNNYKY